MSVDNSYSCSSLFVYSFNKGIELTKENPKHLGVGIFVLGLLAVTCSNMENKPLNATISIETLKESTSQVTTYLYRKTLEISAQLGRGWAILELNSIYIDERIQILENILERMVSIEGIDSDELEGYLLVLLRDSEYSFADQCSMRRQNFSLKNLCSGIDELSNEQLPESIDIAERLINSLKDEGQIPELINFCSEDPSRVQSLFSIVHYLGLDNFQNKYLEPFNKVFSGISLDQAPITIRQLDLSEQKIGNINFSKFEFLKTLDLTHAKGLTATQFNTIPLEAKASIEDLNLNYVDVTNFDFSGFTNLKTLNFCGGISYHHQQKYLTHYQFNAIPSQARASIEALDLSWMYVTNFDFSEFTHLKTLVLECTSSLTAAQFNAIPSEAKASIENLHLSGALTNVTGFGFSEFTNLKTLDLSCIQGLTAAQFNAIPLQAKVSIETLNLNDIDVTNFDFSGFTNLKTLDLSCIQGLTAAQFNTISQQAKASIETLNLNDIDVTNFDFSGFTNLKTLDLSCIQSLTAAQFNAIPLQAKVSIES
jgi:hypothetical protein